MTSPKTPSSKPALPKRFYQDVTLVQKADGYQIELDGRTVKTPGKKPMVVPTRGLAEAIAAEWSGQVVDINAAAMPLTGLAQTASDHGAQQRVRLVGDILRYSKSDLLCYRAEGPDSLVKRQSNEWQPLLDWASETLGVRFDVTAGLAVVDQPEASLSAAQSYIDRLSDFQVSGLSRAVALLGSFVLGIAMCEGRLDAGQALDLSLLDELWQAQQWGEDDEAAARRVALRKDLGALSRFLDHLREA